MTIPNDTAVGVIQMLQTMTPPYLRYLRNEQPWPETGGFWPFGRARRQSARRAKAEQIAREAIHRLDIQALLLNQVDTHPTDAFQIAKLLISTLTPQVLAKRITLPLDPYVFALLANQIEQNTDAYFGQNEKRSTRRDTANARTNQRRKKQKKP